MKSQCPYFWAKIAHQILEICLGQIMPNWAFFAQGANFAQKFQKVWAFFAQSYWAIFAHII